MAVYIPGCSDRVLIAPCIPITAIFTKIPVSDEQYHSMPVLFSLDDWAGCGAVGGAYCVGSFELTPEHTHERHQLYDMMEVSILIRLQI